MAFLRGAVYPAPSEEFPPLVVVFGSGGEIVETRAVSSAEDGKAALAEIMTELQKRTDGDAQQRSHADRL